MPARTRPGGTRRPGSWSTGSRSRGTRCSRGRGRRPGTARSASGGTSWSGRRDVSPLVHRLRTTTGRRPCRWATRPRATALHWTRDPQNPIFTGSWVEDMCVVKQDGTFQMFAEGKNDIAHRLTSTDGLHWTDQGSLDIRKTDGTPIGPGPYGTPAAWFENGTWYLFYERGDQGVWLATSTDLKVWTNVKDDPVLAMGPEPYDRGGRGAEPGRQARRRSTTPSTTPTPSGPGRTGPPTSPARATWSTGRNTPATRSSRTTARAPSSSTTPEGDRLYTMHPDVKVFEPASPVEVERQGRSAIEHAHAAAVVVVGFLEELAGAVGAEVAGGGEDLGRAGRPR